MMRLIDNHRTTIKNSKTIVSFENNGEYWKKWDRYISIEGKQAYHIGNVCGTCEFFFERLEGANQTINPKEAIEELNIGLNSINKRLENFSMQLGYASQCKDIKITSFNGLFGSTMVWPFSIY